MLQQQHAQLTIKRAASGIMDSVHLTPRAHRRHSGAPSMLGAAAGGGGTLASSGDGGVQVGPRGGGGGRVVHLLRPGGGGETQRGTVNAECCFCWWRFSKLRWRDAGSGVPGGRGRCGVQLGGGGTSHTAGHHQLGAGGLEQNFSHVHQQLTAYAEPSTPMIGAMGEGLLTY
jgi:hypothetical protein